MAIQIRVNQVLADWCGVAPTDQAINLCPLDFYSEQRQDQYRAKRDTGAVLKPREFMTMNTSLRIFTLLVLFLPYCLGQKLNLLSYDPINVDGAGNTASTRLRLRNPDAINKSKCTLSMTDFTSSNTGKRMGVVATFYDKDTPGPPPAAGRAVGSAVAVEAEAGQEIGVKVDFAHLVEAGESKAKLYCDDKVMGELIALKQIGLPFKITVNENPPDKPELAFVKGKALSVQLKNDDPVTYPFSWEVLVKGKSVKGTGTIGANDVTTIEVAPDDAWFSGYHSFFKDETPPDGKLILRYKPAGALMADAFPAKTVAIKPRLSAYPLDRRELQTTLLILLVLAFGGILSSYFNVDLVNRLRMVGIKRRMGNLAKQTGEIAPQLTSQLRVTLLLEHKRITAELPHGILFTPETASLLTQCGTDADGLETRVNLATQVSDAAVREARALQTGTLAPSLADRVDRDLSGAQDLLKKSGISSAEVQRVQSLIADAVNVLDNLNAPDPALEQTLTSRMQELQAKFTDAVKQDPIFVRLQQEAPVPFAMLSSGGSVGSQADRDANSRKLLVVYDLIQIRFQMTDEMIQSLRRQDPLSLQNAELLLREAKDEVTPNDLQTAIAAKPPQIAIVIDRDVVRVNRSSMMRLVFHNPRYNQAAAKRLIECTWHFGHDNLTERGWEIYHYFPKPGAYQVTVTFRDENQTPIPQGDPPKQLDLTVYPPYQKGRSQWAIEIQRWLIGFLVAVLGLFAGAKDKILTLDTLGAIFAVFLLGFTIDMAKNLVIPKQT